MRLSLIARLSIAGLVCLTQTGCASSDSDVAMRMTQSSQPLAVSDVVGALAARTAFFVENGGQLPDPVRYTLEGRNASAYMKADGLLVKMHGPQTTGRPPTASAGGASIWTVSIDFVQPNPSAQPEGRSETPTTVNYLKGPAGSWQTGLRTYASVMYPDLWDGIDLTYALAEQTLKYEAVVHPGGNPDDLKMTYRGASAVHVTAAGELVTSTPLGDLKESPPVVYQIRDGQRQPVAGAYDVQPGSEPGSFLVGYALGAYDPNYALVVDPAVLVYAGFLGGANADYGHDVAVDLAGNVYVGGHTLSTESSFPVVTGPDVTANGGQDAFVAKLDPTGTHLIYATFLGGSSTELLLGLAVDADGNAYVSGETRSADGSFPVVGGLDPTYNGGFRDGFVAKLNSSGSALIYSGFLGGAGGDAVTALALDAQNNVYVTGFTTSGPMSFPVAVGPELTYSGAGSWDWGDAFVAKVNAAGSALVYAGYIGGLADEAGFGIAVDGSGRAYVTGRTESSEASFPVAVGPDLTFNGGYNGDAFIARVAANGASLDYGGYIGGSDTDGGSQVAAGADGTAYVVGLTESDQATFPVILGPDLTFNGLVDTFVARVSSTGSGLLYSGYIGGSDEETWTTITLDSTGQAIVGGSTKSTAATFPVGEGPDLTHNGSWDGFIGVVSADGTAFTDGGYIGGAGDDYVYDIALGSDGMLWATGQTTSTESTLPDGDGFGGLPGRDQSANGLEDALLAKIQFPTPGPGPLFVPVALKGYCAGFLNGGRELEPNNGGASANGPLCTDTTYLGTAGDGYDIFFFESAAGPMTLTLTDHVGQGVQLILYYQQLDAAHEVTKDSSGPEYVIGHTGQAGRYYVSIYTASGFDSQSVYRLSVVHP